MKNIDKTKKFLENKVTRRKFIQNTAMTSVSIAAVAAVGGHDSRLFSQGQQSWRSQFYDSLDKNPWLYAFKGVSEQKLGPAGLVQISGKIPKGLRGTLYRNGPALHEMGSLRYHHLFDGDGMVQAYHIGNNTVGHLGRIIQTKKFKKEFSAGKRLLDGFGTSVPGAERAYTSSDDLNAANISVLHHHGKFFALWEGGSAYEVDEKTLETVAPYVLGEGLEGFPFGPHPRVEKDGTLWNVGYSLARQGLVLYHIDAQGKMLKWKFFDVPNISYFHDFLITENYVILPLSPHRFQGLGSSGNVRESYTWQADEAMEVWVFDKNNFERKTILELPAQFIFHYGNAYEDKKGLIHYDAINYNNSDIMDAGFTDVMRGGTSYFEDLKGGKSSNHVKVVIDLAANTIRQETLPSPKGFVASEFPTVDPRVIGNPYKLVVTVGVESHEDSFPFFNAVIIRNVSNGRSKSFLYSRNEVAEEHIYVPDYSKSPEDGGWVIGTTINFKKKKTYLNIFEAGNLAQGPVARAKLPYATPFSFHGKFVRSYG